MIRSFALALLVPAVFPALFVSLAETAAEQWVRERVASGHRADLLQRSPQDRNGRVLSAGFLTKLLATKSGLDGSPGISIEHGIVLDELDLERLEAIYDIQLNEFEFDALVDLSGAHFHRSLTITRSVFKGELQGYRLVVDEDFAICGPPLTMPNDHAEAHSRGR